MWDAKKPRFVWIDLVRALAILLVVLVHSVEASMAMKLETITELGIPMRMFLFLCYSMGRLAVPLFLMISGFLLLDRTYSREGCIAFWKRSWLELLAVTELWNVIYLVFLALCRRRTYTLTEIVLQLLFLKSSDMNHMWYMPMILGWYVLVPLMANTLGQTDLSLLKFPIGILSFFAFVVPVANIYFMANTPGGLTTFFLPGLYDGGYYGLYMMMGYLVKKGVFRKIKGWTLALTGLCAMAMTVGIQLYSYARDYAYNTRYNLGTLALCALCLFELASRYSGRGLPLAIRWLSAYSFAVYLIHNIFRTLIRDHVNWIGSIPLRVGFLWATTVLLSCLAVGLICRIPRIGRRMLYLKG